MRGRILAVAVAVIAITSAAAPAVAADDSRRAAAASEVARILEQVPGAVQLDATTLVAGDVTFTVDDGSNARDIASCPTGNYCAWRGSGYTGTRVDFVSCSASGTTSLLTGLGGPARSVANARLSGTVQLRDGTTTVATMTANSGDSNWTASIDRMVCFT
jgi:hypothetical protein